MRVPNSDSSSVPACGPRRRPRPGSRRSDRILTAAAACALVAAACTGGDEPVDTAAQSGVPTIVATTNIWADVVENVTCNGLVEVEALMPPGSDPHTFEPSLRDRADMAEASMVVANGLDLEESLEDTLDAVAADGTPVFYVGDHLEPIIIGEAGSGDSHDEDGHDDEDGHHDDDEHDESDHDEDGHDEDEDGHHDDDEHDESDHDEDGHDEDEDGHHDDDEHDESDHDDDGHDEDDAHEGEGGHAHTGADPHIWFDPVRVSSALGELAHAIADATGLNESEIEACAADYREALDDAHHQTLDIVAELDPDSRVLVTNHDALSYFADRYGFRVVGTVIPGTTTAAEASIAHLEALAEIIEHEGVAAIFSETTHAAETAEQLASQIGGVEVVSLDTGSLGPAGSSTDTYLGLLTSNAETIVAALQSGG